MRHDVLALDPLSLRGSGSNSLLRMYDAARGAFPTVAAGAGQSRPGGPGLCARWAVFDATLKEVAVSEYNQRVAAEEEIAALLGRQRGTYFLEIVKEPMPEPAPVAVHRLE